jgi:hypothetical protein
LELRTQNSELKTPENEIGERIMTKQKKPLTFFTLPWPIFLVITVVCLLATYLGVLPKGMAGCFLFMRACERKSVKSQMAEAFCDRIKNTGGFCNGEQEERVLQAQAHDRGEAEHHPGIAAGVQH